MATRQEPRAEVREQRYHQPTSGVLVPGRRDELDREPALEPLPLHPLQLLVSVETVAVAEQVGRVQQVLAEGLEQAQAKQIDAYG